MKKYSYISMLAAAAMAAFSCAKEKETIADKTPNFTPKVITAYCDRDIEPDTKTYLDGVSVLWKTTDAIKGYDLSDLHTSTATVVSVDKKKAEFTFATVNVEDNLMWLGYPASNISNIDDDYVYATIPSNQVATVGSFADGANVSVAEGLNAEPQFKNVGGLLSFVIRNDNITSVTLSANENLTGDAKISMANATFAEATITSGKNFVEVSGTIVNGSTYYAVVYPGTYTGLKIEVTNSEGKVATYSNPNALVVDRNANLFIAELEIPAGKWENIEKGVEYVMTPATNCWAGWSTYSYNGMKWTPELVNGNDTPTPGSYTAGKGYQFGTGAKGIVELTLTGNGYKEISVAQSANSKAFGITDLTVSMAAKSGNTYTVTAKVGGVTVESAKDAVGNGNTPAEVTFHSATPLHGDILIDYSFKGDGGDAGYLCVNTVTINPDTRTAQNLSFPQTAYAVEISEGTFESPVLSGANTTVTYSSDDEDVATVNANTGLVTLKAAGTVNITATAAANATYKSATASYELTVNPGPSTIAGVIEASTSSSVYTHGVVAQVNQKGFILTDGTDNVFVYQNTVPTVVVGQAVKVSGTRGINNNVPQINGTIVVTPGETGQTINRTSLTTITSSNAKGHSYSTYVSLAGELTISGTYVNVSISGSTVKGSLYQLSGSEVFTGGTVDDLDGAPVVVTGYITGSTNTYLYIAVVDIVLNPDIAYLSTTPADGETIEWDDDVYGAGNAETITIVQNGNATGYNLNYTDSENAWNVSDNGSGTVTVYPKAANTSSTTNKTLTLTITHKDDALQSSEITLSQKKQGGPTWTRVTSVATLLAGGTFIMGYEATAKSGVIIPLRSKDCGATTSVNGIFNSGTTNNNSTNGTIDMSDLSDVTTSDYEVYISASSTNGCVNIQRVNNTGNYYGSSSTGSSKNTARLYSSGNSNETNLIPEFSDEENNQFKLRVNVTGDYKYLKYNTGSPRFAFYNSEGNKIVFYKKD